MAVKPRIAIFDAMNPRERSFMGPLAAHLEKSWHVDFQHTDNRERIKAMTQNVAQADVVWLEWCLPPAIAASNDLDLRDKKVIVRLHSFEAIDTNCPNDVAWENVDHLILVGADVLQILRLRWPDLERRVDIQIIPNAVDCERYASNAAKRMTDIAWVGRIEMKKNPGLFLQIMAKLVALDPAYRLHVAGHCSDLRVSRYLSHLIGQMGLQQNIIFYDYVNDMPAWFQDKGVLLSTSLYESFGMNIGEAMASGAFPVIHDFPGARGIWPPECVFSDVDEAVDLIRNAKSGLYTDYVRARYDAGLQFAAVDSLLASPNRKCAEREPQAEVFEDLNALLTPGASCTFSVVEEETRIQPRSQRLVRRAKRRNHGA